MYFAHPIDFYCLTNFENNILRSNVEENEFIHINRLARLDFRGF